MPTKSEIKTFIENRYKMLAYAQENQLETLERIVRKNIDDMGKLKIVDKSKQLTLF